MTLILKILKITWIPKAALNAVWLNEPFNGNDQLADYKPFNPPSKPMLTGPKNNTINNSNNKNEDYEVNSELSYELYCYSDEETL